MTTYSIDLPYTSPPLSLNGGVPTSAGAMHAKRRLIASVRRDGALLARSARLPRNVAHATIRLHYRPRTRRHRDPINLTPTQKALVDGLRDFGLVPDDDPRFVTDLMPAIHPVEKGRPGALWLTVTITDHSDMEMADRSTREDHR
jgi:crossover junction endodeoxyribonuclease RusA